MFDFKSTLTRYFTKILIQLKKLQGTPYSIAAGFACGVAISFTPFIGFHLILAALTAWIIRGNIVSSAIGTLIGNPWTFPFIWIAVLSTGRFFLGLDNTDQVNFAKVFDLAWQAIKTFEFRNFSKSVWPIIFSMMVGSIPFYIASWIISYKIIKKTMDKLSLRKQKQPLMKDNTK